jgi:hypothetical protein
LPFPLSFPPAKNDKRVLVTAKNGSECMKERKGQVYATRTKLLMSCPKRTCLQLAGQSQTRYAAGQAPRNHYITENLLHKHIILNRTEEIPEGRSGMDAGMRK